MRKPHSRLNAATAGAVLGFGLLALVGSSEATADTPPAGSETYTWSAELVEFDGTSHTATVKARVVGEDENIEADSLSDGDRAMLTWSGITFGAGVRALEAGSESSFDRMTMPVEFVSLEENGTQLVFRVEIPEDDAGAIADLEPGEWVTATSPHQPGSPAEAVLSMRPYGDVE